MTAFCPGLEMKQDKRLRFKIQDALLSQDNVRDGLHRREGTLGRRMMLNCQEAKKVF